MTDIKRFEERRVYDEHESGILIDFCFVCGTFLSRKKSDPSGAGLHCGFAPSFVCTREAYDLIGWEKSKIVGPAHAALTAEVERLKGEVAELKAKAQHQLEKRWIQEGKDDAR